MMAVKKKYEIWVDTKRGVIEGVSVVSLGWRGWLYQHFVGHPSEDWPTARVVRSE